LELGSALRLAVDLSGVINRLHQRGIIHKDIKPANVLADPQTGRCWLKGFGIASRLPRERQSAEPPELVAGTLAYMAPEQTGRMNRSIDCRSDLYALGVSLYEMLTGTLPFAASDPMEWVHCHIARKPVPPAERANVIPASVSAIVMKLLAKTAEERYQTAAGVEADLRRCLELLEGSSGSRRIRHSRSSAASHETQSSPKAKADPRDSLSRRAIRTRSKTPILQHSTTPAAGIEDDDEVVSEIPEFPLGQHDRPNQLLIPEKLYGRDREINILLASFERVVASGRPELVLVSGYSGIGKSSVVSELHQALIPQRGFFASGKVDQYKRDIPYSTLAQAFQGLIRPLLGRSDTELRRWGDAFREALGPNGQLIVDLIPELALILGLQPPMPELPAQDAQRRFQLVFRRFISVFARPEHPLALFLDDLQWLDGATLDLFEDLATQSDVQHLMLIGAYRDNEVDRSHPLVRKLGSIRRAGGTVQEIILTPLSYEDLGRLIADSLHCQSENGQSEGVTPLAQLVHEKTNGNPFFAIQFLSALTEEGLLTFDHAAGRWSWDLTRIHAKGYTDNVVDLMVAKLNRLPVETQEILKEFACLGNSAELNSLSIVRGASEERVQSDLWEALRLEFVVGLNGSYRFVHDRIQEAAYLLIPEELRAENHLRIGRLLTAQTSPESLEEAVFEIVNQLNRGALLISSRDEREQLAELNLLAGKRARASTAHTSALNYFIDGAALLADDRWERRHQLTFDLEFYRAECEFLTGELAAAEERLTTLSIRAANTVERATVECLRIDLYTTLDQPDRAVTACLDYLRHLGVEWSVHPTKEEARREYEQIWLKLGNRAIEELTDLPLMSDPESLATLDVLTKIQPPANYTDANLYSLAICKAISLSLEQGNTDGSCATYVTLGMIAGSYFGNYQDGYRFGRLGCELIEKRGLTRFQARTRFWFASQLMPWTKHLLASRDIMRETFEAANKIGDLTLAAYSHSDLNTHLLAAGDPLPVVHREAEDGLEFTQKARFGFIADIITAQLGLVRTLRGLTRKFGSFDDEKFDELGFERHLASDPVLAFPECWYWIRKLQARFLAGDYASAVDASLRAHRSLWRSAGHVEKAEYYFYGALSRAACCDSEIGSFAEASKEEHFDALIAHYKQLEIWAQNCPENFENRVALVGAEIARIEGRELDAERLYEKAIRSARANGFIHNEALASELAARFYGARGFDTIAHAYLRKARYCYLQWGADGKVRQLDGLYPQLREEERLPGPTSTIGASVENLDLAAVIKVSQTVSGEIVLEKLIDTLMRTALEHAGAERGLLILSREAEQRVEAEAVTSGDTIVVRLREAAAREASVAADAGGFMAEPELPESIVQYVVRTQESVILDDAASHNAFSSDPYLRQQHARSILCLPLTNQAKLIGVLYLENDLTPHVFTPTRIAVLKLLASQAAISLENTHLYRDLEKREAKIRRLVDANIMGVFIWNFEGQIIEANEAFLHMVKYSREDLVSGGLSWKDLTPPEWRDLTERGIAQLTATGILQPYEKEYFRNDRSRVPVLVGSAVLEEGHDEGISFVLDLSEQKHAQDKRKRAEEAAQKAQAELAHVARVTALGELTASIAHEVNQPLGAIVNYGNAGLRFLKAGSPDLTQIGTALSAMVADANRASAIIARIRALSKKSPPELAPLQIKDLVTDTQALVQHALTENRIALKTTLAGDLSPVLGDRIQLQQVLLNLVVNSIEALKKVPDGWRQLSIEAQSQVSEDKPFILITVKDSGIGLKAEDLPRLFETFYTTKAEGMGMGLAISRSIVEAHGGRLWATPNTDVGATFQFVLPAQTDAST
jgi:PAS domain S-box-containing protein